MVCRQFYKNNHTTVDCAIWHVIIIYTLFNEVFKVFMEYKHFVYIQKKLVIVSNGSLEYFDEKWKT